MRKIIKFIVLIGITIFFSSCKNFLNGSDFIKQLDDTITYLQAPYADITIIASNKFTENISPTVGNYNKTYKCNDSFELEFIPSGNYKFVNWSVIPENSVEFKNINNSKTTVIIKKSDSPITIEPKAYERPIITVSPDNLLENPRNSTIVITFSQSMHITEEDVTNIQILIDDFDGKEYFYPPEISNDKTTITYIPRRDNLIPVGSVSSIVKVVVPESFHYLVEDTNICLKDDFTYSYKINATTETKVNLNIDCELTEGDISYRGNKSLYLDDEITLKVNPKEDYILNDWSVVYKDNREAVGNDILEVTFSEDYSELKLKVLTGSDREIDIFPVFSERGYITVNFTSEHGITTPSEQKKYYVGDVFSLSFREIGFYSFLKWNAFDAEGRDVSLLRQIDTGDKDEDGNPVYDIKPVLIKFTDSNKIDTECEVLSGGETITIDAVSSEIPTVLAMSPSILANNVSNNTKIRVYFSIEMDEKSIYWTEEEVYSKIGKKFRDNYNLEIAKGKKSPEGKQYIYAYSRKDDPADKHYKNIEIKNRNTSFNYAQYCGEPRFDDNYTLVIPFHLPENRKDEIEIKFSSSFISKDNKTLDKSFTTIFTTNGKLEGDVTPPVIDITGFNVLGIEGEGNILQQCKKEEDYPDNYSWNTLNQTNSEKIKVVLEGNVLDGETDATGIKSVTVSLIPIYTELFKNTNTYFMTNTYNDTENKSVVSLDSKNATFEFNMKDYEEGPYKIIIKAKDENDNEAIYENVYAIVNNHRENPVCTINDFGLPLEFPILRNKEEISIRQTNPTYTIKSKEANTEIKCNQLTGYTYYIRDLKGRVVYNLNTEKLTVRKLFGIESDGIITTSVGKAVTLYAQDYFGNKSAEITIFVELSAGVITGRR